MATEILMPALSPTMEQGKIAKWLVGEGDAVSSGDPIAEIETDKAIMEFEAADEGVMGKILVEEGAEGVTVNTPIALLLDEGEDPAKASVNAAPPKSPAKESESKPSTPAPSAQAAPGSVGLVAETSSQARVFSSPLARRIAKEKGLDLSAIKGSGPRGRIVRRDVEAASPTGMPSQGAPMPASPSSEMVKAMYAGRDYEEVSLDGMRKTVAARLTEAKQTIPHFYLRRDIALDSLLEARSMLNADLEASGAKISVNDFIIRACAQALQKFPGCNSVWASDRILRLIPSDVAVAVAVEGGLFTPVIKDAHAKSLLEISSEMKELAQKARSRRLAPEEYQGGSFAISNLGMFGIDNFDAVINPPHGSILAVGAGVKKPIADEDGTVRAKTVMSVTLSVDHRVIDGALGAQFLSEIRRRLENPAVMLV